LNDLSQFRPERVPVVLGCDIRNFPPFETESGLILWIYAAAASDGEILLPPPEIAASGSLKVRR